MRISRAARDQLLELLAEAAPLQGDFFRSVAFKYFHPDDVISGEGTRLHGGRFVPLGVKAVYASCDEETAMREVATRKTALGGRSQIDVADYPRMTYVLSVDTRRNLNLAGRLRPELQSLVAQSIRLPGYAHSQELAKIWITQEIESVIFPSATGTGQNIVVYLANAGSKSVAVRNRDQVLAALRKPKVKNGRTGRERIRQFVVQPTRFEPLDRSVLFIDICEKRLANLDWISSNEYGLKEFVSTPTSMLRLPSMSGSLPCEWP